jgi:PleD family two-component response regulator
MKDNSIIKNKILVVDDTETNIEIVMEFLNNKYDVLVALDGKTAIEIANEEDIDLILLDILMPVMDGFEVCSILKNNTATKNIPIIFITTQTDDEFIQKAFEMGGGDYIKKPFRPIELLSRINNHLNSKKYQEILISENLHTKTNLQNLKTHVIKKSSSSQLENNKLINEYKLEINFLNEILSTYKKN